MMDQQMTAANLASQQTDFTPTHIDPVQRDHLTQLPNRIYMLGQIATLIGARAAQAAYLVIGIDKMAFVNEAVGTKAADKLLVNVASRLTSLLPEGAHLARVSGDMFGLLLSESADLHFKELGQRILQNFRDHPVETVSAQLHITVSIGGMKLNTTLSDAGEAMIRAEQALCEARQRGRNVMVEYQSSPARSESRRVILEMGELVKHALKHHGLRLAYQPVLDAHSGKILFYEALVRMFRSTGEMIPAADFVPAIEELGLALDLDYRVLDLAVAELEAHPTLRLAMNISGFTAGRADWPDYIQQKLAARPQVANRLIVEITETVAITDVNETKRFAEVLRDLGGRVALDDFGAGFTSIRHLRSLSLAILKIDRELLLNLVGNPEQEHLVRMLLSIAHGLNLKTVAEGVETEDVANWLRREQVDMMQGYFFGRPQLERPSASSDVKTHVSPDLAQNLMGPMSLGGQAEAPMPVRVAAFTQI